MAGKITPATIHQELLSIRSTLERIESDDNTRKAAFSTLYKELEQYKQDFIFQLEKGLLFDLLLFYDSLLWFQNRSEEQSQEERESAQFLIEEFLEVLQRRDVTPFAPASEFDPKLHRVVQTIPTTVLELDHHIQAVFKQGFFRGEQVLRIEEVILYKYSPEKSSEQEDESNEK